MLTLSRHLSEFIALVSIQGRRRISAPDRGATAIPDAPKVNHLYGVKAWKSWVQRRNKGPTESEPQFYFLYLPAACWETPFSDLWTDTSSVRHSCAPIHPVDIKEDVLQCDSAELSYALSHFIREARRPNGEPYSADSIFYLCLGIQQVHTLVVASVRRPD